MRLAAAVLLALMFATSGLSATKPKPKPWMWTTATAVQQIRSVELDPFNETAGTTTISRCVGKGKHVGRSYVTFACPASFKPASITDTAVRPLTLWVKVRRVGRGEPCLWTSAAVPAACTNAHGARVAGDRTDAKTALVKTLGNQMGSPYPYQGPTDCAAWGVGFFRCWFGANASADPTAGWATVILLKTGPAVTVTKAFVKT